MKGEDLTLAEPSLMVSAISNTQVCPLLPKLLRFTTFPVQPAGLLVTKVHSAVDPLSKPGLAMTFEGAGGLTVMVVTPLVVSVETVATTVVETVAVISLVNV